jgi:hypothetical protein
MKTVIRIASIAAIAAILLSLIGTIAMAETVAAAKSEKWRCGRFWGCRQFDKSYRATGRRIMYGTVIHVTSRTSAWLRSDFNSSVARVYYIRADFSYKSTD